MRHSRIQQRGIVLLIVLSLLTLFAILGVTFLLVSGQYRKAAYSNSRVNRRTTSPEKFLHMGMLQLLRDSQTRSVIRTHSLLRDIYGNDGVRCVVVDPPGPQGPPALDSTVGGEFLVLRGIPVPASNRLSDQPDYYAGRVITFLTGSGANISARVVDYRATRGADGAWGTTGDDNNSFSTDGAVNERAERFWLGSDDFAVLRCELLAGRGTGTVIPEVGSQFLINGQPFNGTGHGYNPLTSNLDQLTDLPGADGAWGGSDDVQSVAFHAALMPNQMVQRPIGFPSSTLGGADEDYDTFDYQNMFLAMVPPDLTNVPEIIPSFHRPALVNYWFNWAVNNITSISSMTTTAQQWAAFSAPYGNNRVIENPGDDPALTFTEKSMVISILRSIIMRPLLEDHPNFALNNTSLHYLGNRSGQILADGSGGRWDVDNDGDGIPDSIWVDIGLPVQTAPDGRRFRPLVAILCQDLDGRLNLNAHDKDPNVITATTFFSGRYNLNNVNGKYAGTVATAATNNDVLLTRALGTGPVDVSLGPLFHEQLAASPEYGNLLEARYRSGTFTEGGVPSSDDPLSAIKFHHMPNNYSTDVSSYLSPPDLNGVMAIGLDHYGQPLPKAVLGANANVDDPYEMFLGNHFGEVRSVSDAPFTVSELERLLRYNDKDASRLPSRLVSLAQRSFANSGNRQRATVLSSYVPVTASAMFPGERGSTPASSILDLYFARLLANADSSLPLQQQEDTARLDLVSLVPFEFLHGQRFDLNRAFGNGVDDTANGVVDEPAETSNQKAWHTSKNVPLVFKNANYNGENDDLISSNPRFNYARHLYCLALMLMDQTYELPEHGSDPKSVLATRRRIAQWAVNVVDFRDSDGIMTPFEYDTNPFNGWDTDGNPNTTGESDRDIVWGCEAPDLVITETFAMHDRRVKDTKWDNGLDMNGGNSGPPLLDRRSSTSMRDQDLDQYRIPQGTFVFELLSVRSNHLQKHLELYDTAGNLDLGRMSPSRTTPAGDPVQQPVWRLVTSKTPATANTNQVGAGASFESFEPTSIDRIVWFATVDPTTVNNAANDLDVNKVFYNRTTAAPKLSPNSYMVVGPRASTRFGSLKDQDGEPLTYEGPSPHALNFNMAAGTFSVSDTNGRDVTTPTSMFAASANIRTPRGMVCAANAPTTWTPRAGGGARPIGLNISEPMPRSGGPYYPQPNPADDGRNPSDAYADISLTSPPDAATNAIPDWTFDDSGRFAVEVDLGGDVNTGTRLQHTSCFLQRLADPTRAWNEQGSPTYDSMVPLNPYITVDWATVDLTVFTGEENTNVLLPPEDPMMPLDREWIDEGNDEDPYSAVPANRQEHFKTRQRDGGRSTLTAVGNRGNIWSPNTLTPSGSTNTTDPRAYFPFQLNPNGIGGPGMTLGYLNAAFGNPTKRQTGYAGASASPFPWMAWNNRPFSSPYELMLVPSSSPGRLLLEYSAPRVPTAYFPETQSDPPPPMPPSPVDIYGANGTFSDVSAPSAHLLNFCNSSDTESSDDSANFHRMFDFVEVPSPYIGAEKWYNPASFASGLGGATFRPPFNKLSRFRDPGRVNVNTIIPERRWTPGVDGRWGKALVDDDGNGTVDDASETGWADSDDVREARVWEGIAKSFPELDPARHRGAESAAGRGLHYGARVHPGFDGHWGVANTDDNGNTTSAEGDRAGSDDFTRVFAERLFLSRQGYGTKTNDFLAFNSAYPSRFANPFRSAATADLMPPLAILRKRGVDATFLRPDIVPHFDRGLNGVWGSIGDDNSDGVTDDILEAGYPGTDDVHRIEPLFVPDTSVAPWLNSAYRGQDRNPYFRYQALQHIGNVLSTTSNTFAVWLTVGFFEVEDTPTIPPGVPDMAHPDGLRLGLEVGLDTGDVKRHRAFYIIDRSIPVAYEPGENHNVEKAILLRRFIE